MNVSAIAGLKNSENNLNNFLNEKINGLYDNTSYDDPGADSGTSSGSDSGFDWGSLAKTANTIVADLNAASPWINKFFPDATSTANKYLPNQYQLPSGGNTPTNPYNYTPPPVNTNTPTTSSTNYLMIGGIAVGVLVVGFIGYKLIKK